MSTPLRSTYVAPKASSPEWLDSEHYRFVTGGVTIDASAIAADGNGDKIVASGRVIVKQSNGKWKIAPDVATSSAGPPAVEGIDGRYVAILWEDVNVRNGDEMTGAIDHGRVISARLPVAITADQAAALKGITVR